MTSYETGHKRWVSLTSPFHRFINFQEIRERLEK